MLCGHGSRDTGAVQEFAVVAGQLRAKLPFDAVEYGYLEFAKPIIRDGLDKLRAKGVTKVLAIPGMLFAAGHAKNDIPSVLNAYQAKNEGMTIHYGRELGIDLKMLRAAGDRVAEALVMAGGDVPRHETLLMVVGRGSSDPDANSNVAKVTRMLWEGMGFGWAETSYSGVTFPLVEPGLEHAAKLGYKRIVVFPYFLFTGILVQRIYDYADAVAARYPQIEFIKAGYLNDHPMVLETFSDRVAEILEGTGNMNCQMCKYREQVLGFEAEVGLRQESHHHHVEGIGTGNGAAPTPGHGHDHGHGHGHGHAHAHGHDHPHGHADHEHPHDHPHGHDHAAHGHDHGHDHAHGHDHGHGAAGHHHHPYPHADHPLGPKSMTKRPSD
ncbi:sirohydrochlorin cobaltochelatase [Skermanella stibiiresistens SB22]|uniref:Sirohydrochlorin cobaltochelatase n=2 Tax=Skermanella TaxID=204447 RepID=W9H2I9_9PROT|nr:sirohydrochlorin cobaltochelatase [Skermanella stibiiresistens SB22]